MPLRGNPAFWIWALSALLLAAVAWDSHPGQGNVFRIYRDASERWWMGSALYPPGSGYQYLPTSAWLWTPLLALPMEWGGAVWRVFNWSLFGIGVSRWLRAQGVRSVRAQAWTALIAAGLAWSAGKHGQATLAMAGSLLLGIEAAAQRKSWAAFAFAFGFSIKPLAAVPLLLLAITWPRLGLRTAGMALAFAVLTGLRADLAYVWAQWSFVPTMLENAGRAAQTDHGLMHLTTLLDGLGVTLSARADTSVRALLLIGGAVWVRRLPSGSPVWSLGLYALGAALLLIVSPRSENNTYGIMSPVLAWLVWRAWNCTARFEEEQPALRRTARSAALALVLVFVTSRSVGQLWPAWGASFSRPLVTCLTAAWVVQRVERERTLSRRRHFGRNTHLANPTAPAAWSPVAHSVRSSVRLPAQD